MFPIMLFVALLLYSEIAAANPVIAYIATFLIEGFGLAAGTAWFIGEVIVYTAANLLLASATAHKTRNKNTGLGSGAEVNYYDGEATQRMIVGYVRAGGMETIPPVMP